MPRIFARSQALLLVTVTCVCAANLPAQPPDTLHLSDQPPATIDTVLVFGNKKTKDFVILNEMTLRSGMTATPAAIEYDRGRIYSLGLFARVNIDYQRIDTTGYLIVDVKEQWYVIPIPILGFRDGDPKKVFYGGGLLYNNFRGVNQKLFGAFTLGYDPSFAAEFFDPLIDREENLYFGAGISISTIRSRSALETALGGDFDERHYDAHIMIGKRFTLYQTAGVRAGYGVVAVTKYRTGRTVDGAGRDQNIYAALEYTFDSRNLREYATQGSFVSLSATKYGFGESAVDYARFSLDFRRYTPLVPDFSLATRAYASFITGGLIPTYARTYIGYGDQRIRGWYTTVFEGENMSGGTVELRYALLPAHTIDVSGLPIPEEFAYWRFGINLAIFADVGAAWFRGDKLTLNMFSSGYGGGVHFLLPYSFVGRVEYAWNQFSRGQIILDLRGSI